MTTPFSLATEFREGRYTVKSFLILVLNGNQVGHYTVRS